MIITGAELREQISLLLAKINDEEMYEADSIDNKISTILKNPYWIDEEIEESEILPYMIGRNYAGEFVRVDSTLYDDQNTFWFKDGAPAVMEIEEDFFTEVIDREEFFSIHSEEEMKKMNGFSESVIARLKRKLPIRIDDEVNRKLKEENVKWVFNRYEVPIVGSRKINDGRTYLLEEITVTVKVDEDGDYRTTKSIKHLKVRRNDKITHEYYKY